MHVYFAGAQFGGMERELFSELGVGVVSGRQPSLGFERERKLERRKSRSKRWINLLSAALLIAVNALRVVLAADGGTDRPFKAEFAGQVHWEFPG
jgi:hypothetical protein